MESKSSVVQAIVVLLECEVMEIVIRSGFVEVLGLSPLHVYMGSRGLRDTPRLASHAFTRGMDVLSKTEHEIIILLSPRRVTVIT